MKCRNLEIRRLARIVCFGFALWISRAKASDGASIAVRFQIHPDLYRSQCSRLPEKGGFEKETDFPKLLAKGWVSLDSHNFKNGREFYPCFQNVTVRFPSEAEFHTFLSEADASPQDPFYTGADFELMTMIMKHVVHAGDEKAYRILLLKDGLNSASELKHSLYAILRKNSKAFLIAFGSLNVEQQKIAVEMQYDFNKPLAKQQFSGKAIGGFDAPTAALAREFNRLIAEAARPRKN